MGNVLASIWPENMMHISRLIVVCFVEKKLEEEIFYTFSISAKIQPLPGGIDIRQKFVCSANNVINLFDFNLVVLC